METGQQHQIIINGQKTSLLVVNNAEFEPSQRGNLTTRNYKTYRQHFSPPIIVTKFIQRESTWTFVITGEPTHEIDHTSLYKRHLGFYTPCKVPSCTSTPITQVSISLLYRTSVPNELQADVKEITGLKLLRSPLTEDP